MFQNSMILNGTNIGISKIELNKSDLLVTDKSGNYCFKVCIFYNWKEINNLEIGEKRKIDFNEYILSENNKPALINPTNCFIKKIKDAYLGFYFEFKNLVTETCYMNKKCRFDINLNSLEVKIYINYKDDINGLIIYEF